MVSTSDCDSDSASSNLVDHPNILMEQTVNPDYEKAKELGLTNKDRWGEGIEHHPMSERVVRFISEHDFNDYGMYFDWRVGGDGDNGESLMYQLDAFFEMLDKEGDVS